MAFTNNCNQCRTARSRLFKSGGLFLVGLLIFLTACTPPPIVDAPASNLDVWISVTDTEESPSDGKVPVTVQFYSNGTLVQLASNATVVCNGVNMSSNGGVYLERVPIVSPGGAYNCVHTRNGVATSVSVTVPARPVFSSPTQGATVARSNSLTITYIPGSGSGIRGWASDGATALGGNVQPDNGAYTGFDVRSLKAGPGTISLTREFKYSVSGTGFKSVEIRYSSGSDIKVTWS